MTTTKTVIRGKQMNKKDIYEMKGLTFTMSLILGIIGALEIILAGTMIFNIDVRHTDGIALFFAFLIVFLGIVAVLTDRQE